MPLMRPLLLTLTLFTITGPLTAEEPPPGISGSLVRIGSWSERWPSEGGQIETREVRGEIWTDAFQAALDKHQSLRIPARQEPYYLDGPLILKSGGSIHAEPGAEIRLLPGTNTCMVRNEHILGFTEQAVPDGLVPDTDITVEGGIWTTLATSAREWNGNDHGRSAKESLVPGTHGVILLQNVRRVTVKNLTIRQSRAFGVHLANAHEFTVSGIKLDRQRRDGVHVNGPASQGLIRDVSGDSADDTVALNAWDWKNYTPSYGPIHHVVIEDVTGAPDGVPSANSIRLLPGVKRFADGSTLDCPIHDIQIRDITDIDEYKLYDQPNLELGRDKDSSARPGLIRDISMEKLTFRRPGRIRVATEVDGLSIDGVDLFLIDPAFKLVEIGPMSQTYRHGPDPAKWVEVFTPDADVTVKRFRLSNVLVQGMPLANALKALVSVQDQTLNLDYPQTTPKGGTGKAKLVR